MLFFIIKVRLWDTKSQLPLVYFLFYALFYFKFSKHLPVTNIGYYVLLGHMMEIKLHQLVNKE